MPGAGLYEVGPGKTYATIQAALDQLWTDQGSATFTTSQYIRIFADTYAENVTPNASLNPDEVNGCALIIEGDPADVRDNIIVAPAGGIRVFYVNCDQCMLRHMKIAGTPTGQMIRSDAGCQRLEVIDCWVTGAKVPIFATYYLLARDCLIVTPVNAMGIYGGGTNYGCKIIDCTIIGPGRATSTLQGVRTAARGLENSIEGTVISGFRYGVYLSQPGGVRLVNSTIYDCTYGANLPLGLDAQLRVINDIFSAVDYPFFFDTTWPEEVAAYLGPTVVQRNNCFHGYTAIGWDGAVGKTFAEWVAFNQVDAAGDLDAIDPLLTNPGSGDFSLQAASPCRHAGHGSGVTKDVDGDPYDPYHPDIGAKSTGIGPNVAYSS